MANESTFAISSSPGVRKTVVLTIVVAALGYLVDMYDLVLFGIYRLPSLRDLGVSQTEILSTGISLINIQTVGLILGGMLWGMLGDKRGRKSVLLGSILFYSLANIANGFVQNVGQYMVLRFFAGLGLAGELGAAVTLISEVMSSQKRGLGSSILFSVGFMGALLACMIAKFVSWRMGYVIGGAMGLALLAMRAGLLESGMYTSILDNPCKRGSFRMLFQKGRWKKYLCAILIGVPTWFGAVVGAFIPEFAKDLGVTGPVSAADGILVGYVGVIFGSIAACSLSQSMKSRKKVIGLFILVQMTSYATLLVSRGTSPSWILFLLAIGGFGAGYAALYATVAAEIFGTNLRTTAASTVSNFIRAAVIPITLSLQGLTPQVGMAHAALIVQAVVVVISLSALFPLEETFGKDLNYVEI